MPQLPQQILQNVSNNYPSAPLIESFPRSLLIRLGKLEGSTVCSSLLLLWQGHPQVSFNTSHLGKSSMGKVTQTLTICFPWPRVEFMIFASDSDYLGWLAFGIRPIPAFGYGYPSGWWGCPNIVGFQIW